MRAEELLEKLSDEELIQKANGCFIQAENTGLYQQAGPEERQRLLMEADLYLKALAWRHDERVSQRDLKLEIWVIFLIGIEIALSAYGLWEGHQQGKLIDKQTTALTHMDTTSGTTTEAMTAARDSLKSLAEQQSKSLERLNEMDEALHASLTQTGRMASATGQQLAILKQEQEERAAQLKKKPKLSMGLSGNERMQPRTQNETSATYDLYITNNGDAKATNTLIRLQIHEKNASLSTSVVPYDRLSIEPEDAPMHTYFLHPGDIRPHAKVALPLTFSFPKGQPSFGVIFTVDTDEIAVGTPLGLLIIPPPKPPEQLTVAPK
jgi:hypothetical protein